MVPCSLKYDTEPCCVTSRVTWELLIVITTYVKENEMIELSADRHIRHCLKVLLPVMVIAVMAFAAEAMGMEPAPAAAPIPVTVYKTPNCGCCTLWAEHMQENGFAVDVKMVSETQSLRSHLGIPDRLASCHTAVVGDYWVEGHVPADLIARLLAESPSHVEGIAAPGMPLGSPGMEAPNASTYEVVTLDDQGAVEVYETVRGRTEK